MADEATVEETKEETKSKTNPKFAKLIEDIKGLSVMELSELVKALEDELGVSAAAPMAVAAMPGAAAGAGAAAEEEKSSYTLHLADAGAQKIAVIKAIREIRPDLGLKEAKDLVDGAPKEVKKDMPKDEAEAAKGKLEAAGAKAELK
ncbi:50S ribosomal protein L7/L12 [Candidatus Berkelbacteria bacterium]|nr:50S ribosomal protein L7/L12 [Candidatus Berkelbacteria bacterium]